MDINHAYFHWLFPHFQGVLGKEKAELFRSNAVVRNFTLSWNGESKEDKRICEVGWRRETASD